MEKENLEKYFKSVHNSFADLLGLSFEYEDRLASGTGEISLDEYDKNLLKESMVGYLNGVVDFILETIPDGVEGPYKYEGLVRTFELGVTMDLITPKFSKVIGSNLDYVNSINDSKGDLEMLRFFYNNRFAFSRQGVHLKNVYKSIDKPVVPVVDVLSPSDVF